MVCHMSRGYVPLGGESLAPWCPRSSWCLHPIFSALPELPLTPHLSLQSEISGLSTQPSSGDLRIPSSYECVNLSVEKFQLLGKNTWYQPFCDLMAPFLAANELHD